MSCFEKYTFEMKNDLSHPVRTLFLASPFVCILLQIGAGGKAAADATQCLTDTFSVTNPGGGYAPPTICGRNTGEHSTVLQS